MYQYYHAVKTAFLVASCTCRFNKRANDLQTHHHIKVKVLPSMNQRGAADSSWQQLTGELTFTSASSQRLTTLWSNHTHKHPHNSLLGKHMIDRHYHAVKLHLSWTSGWRLKLLQDCSIWMLQNTYNKHRGSAQNQSSTV